MARKTDDKPDKLRAEWFWCDRWKLSSAFELPIAARGLYREMLTAAWLRGAKLPNDHAKIQTLIGVSAKDWRALWPLVSRYWREDGADLVNDTQIEVYAEAKRRAEADSAKGKAGAKARWRDAQAGAQADARADARALPGHVPEQMPEQRPEQVPGDVFGQCPLSLDQEHVRNEHTPPLPRRTTPVHLLREPEFETALAICHGVIEIDPTGSEASWRAGVKQVCLQQGWNYAARHADHEAPLVDRALAAAIATRKARAAKASMLRSTPNHAGKLGVRQ
jgi:uncharacterized protein YdaU (DUF1376 family)